MYMYIYICIYVWCPMYGHLYMSGPMYGFLNAASALFHTAPSSASSAFFFRAAGFGANVLSDLLRHWTPRAAWAEGVWGGSGGAEYICIYTTTIACTHARTHPQTHKRIQTHTDTHRHTHPHKQPLTNLRTSSCNKKKKTHLRKSAGLAIKAQLSLYHYSLLPHY